MGKSPFVPGLQLELRASRLILCSHAILLWTATAMRWSKVDDMAKKRHFSGTSFYWSRNSEAALTDFLGNCSDSRFLGLVERSLKSHWILCRFSAAKGKILELLAFMVEQQWTGVFSQKTFQFNSTHFVRHFHWCIKMVALTTGLLCNYQNRVMDQFHI